jgi:hypothetical protein
MFGEYPKKCIPKHLLTGQGHMCHLQGGNALCQISKEIFFWFNNLINYICLKLKGIISYSKMCLKNTSLRKNVQLEKEEQGRKLERNTEILRKSKNDDESLRI